MNFFDGEFARYARSTIKRRRGWALLLAILIGWIVVIALGYGLYRVVAHF